MLMGDELDAVGVVVLLFRLSTSNISPLPVMVLAVVTGKGSSEFVASPFAAQGRGLGS
jgi:hypothetical protein